MKRYTIRDMQAVAAKRGGVCLSSDYKNMKTKLWWKCAKSHDWDATPDNIFSGTWCPECAGKRNLDIEDAHKLAALRGGKCLSKVYEPKGKLLWECSNKHQFKLALIQARFGQWCRQCSSKLSERMTRVTFEYLLEGKFPACRPAWLVGPKGSLLELDGYSEELGVAFEYQGEQHYNPKSHFYAKGESFKQRVALDQLKKKICLEQGVSLIEIHYFENTASLEEVFNQIKKTIQDSTNQVLIKDFSDEIYHRAYHSTELNDLKKLAQSKNGRLISCSYLGMARNHTWQCAEGHQWEATPNSIKSNGSWCKYCAGVAKKTLEEVREFAKLKGGKCLSEKYVNIKTKLYWECSEGHRWEADPRNVLHNKSWCGECNGGKPDEIRKFKEIAKTKGGLCLSNYYENQHTVLSFRCKQGHEWSTEAGNVSNGAWCHECGGSKPLTLANMHEMAAEKGGKCLSGKYLNVDTHLQWECNKGHIFAMKPNNVRIGHWCRECGIEKSGLNRRLSIEEFHEIAKSRGGKCLSSEYFGQSVKLMWECSQGHAWPATPKNIKKGRWCPKCAKQRRKTR